MARVPNYDVYGKSQAAYPSNTGPYGPVPYGSSGPAQGYATPQYGGAPGYGAAGYSGAPTYNNAPTGGIGGGQYGYGVAPASGYGGAYAPPPHYPGSGNRGPPPGISGELWAWFQSVDGDKNGKITAEELQTALLNGNWSPFNAETCRLMVGMFDTDRNGTIDIHEFAALWKYIQDWKSCFDRFDTDHSGNIDVNELHNAFRTFGYQLSPNFSTMCVRIFDRKNVGNIQFDDFIQCCVMLKALTDKFKEKDVQMKGVINVHYEDFLRMVLDNTITL